MHSEKRRRKKTRYLLGSAERGSGDVGDVPVEERKRVAAKGGAEEDANAGQPKRRPRRHYPLHLLVAGTSAVVGGRRRRREGSGEMVAVGTGEWEWEWRSECFQLFFSLFPFLFAFQPEADDDERLPNVPISCHVVIWNYCFNLLILNCRFLDRNLFKKISSLSRFTVTKINIP